MPATAELLDRTIHLSDPFKDRQGRFWAKSTKAAPPVPVFGQEVWSFEYLTPNQLNFGVVVLDVDAMPDGTGLIEAWQDTAFFTDEAALPLPHWSLRTSRGFQAGWLLADPVPLRAPKPVKYLLDLRTRMQIVTGADLAHGPRSACRSPFFQEARVLQFAGPERRYKLAELEPRREVKVPARIRDIVSRTYEEGRRYTVTFRAALQEFKRRNHDMTAAEIEEFIWTLHRLHPEINEKAHAITADEVRDTAKGIVRNGWRYKVCAARDYGAAALPKVEWSRLSPQERLGTIRARQAAGAHYTHNKRVTGTLERLEAIADELARAGTTLTQSVMVTSSGLSRKTIQTHWDFILRRGA